MLKHSKTVSIIQIIIKTYLMIFAISNKTMWSKKIIFKSHQFKRVKASKILNFQ